MDRNRALEVIKAACVKAAAVNAAMNAVARLRKSAQAAAPAPAAAPTTGKYKGLSASQVEEKLKALVPALAAVSI